MADAVAIISVLSSGVVGLAGIGSTVYSSARLRRWQAREERTTNLRDVLDTAAETIGTSMQQLADAHQSPLGRDSTSSLRSGAMPLRRE